MRSVRSGGAENHTKLTCCLSPYLESEDHVEFLALEPTDCVGVLRHGQRLAPDPEEDAGPLHHPEAIYQSAHPEHDLHGDGREGGSDSIGSFLVWTWLHANVSEESECMVTLIKISILAKEKCV